MTEAILASKEIEEFPGEDEFRLLASFYAIFVWLTKDLFVSYGPCNA